MVRKKSFGLKNGILVLSAGLWVSCGGNVPSVPTESIPKGWEVKFKAGDVVFGQTTTFGSQGISKQTETPLFLKEAIIGLTAPQATDAQSAVNLYVQLLVDGKPIQQDVQFVASGSKGKGTAWLLKPGVEKKNLWWVLDLEPNLGSGKYTAEIAYAGKTARLISDLQPATDLTPPVIKTLSLTANVLDVQWEAVPNARSYSVYVLEDKQTGLNTSNMTVAFNATTDVNSIRQVFKDRTISTVNQNHYVVVIANGWDNMVSGQQPLKDTDQFASAVGFAVIKAQNNVELNRSALPETVLITSEVGTTGTALLSLAQKTNNAPDLLYTAKIEGNPAISLQDPGKGRLKAQAGHNLTVAVNCTQEGSGEATVVLQHLNDFSQAEDRIPLRYHCVKKLNFTEQFSKLQTGASIMTLEVAGQRNEVWVARQNALEVYNTDLQKLRTLQYPEAVGNATGLRFNADQSQLLMQQNKVFYNLNVVTGQHQKLFAASDVVTGVVVDFGWTANQDLWFIAMQNVAGKNVYQFKVVDASGKLKFEDSGKWYVARNLGVQMVRFTLGGSEFSPEAQQLETINLNTFTVGAPVALSGMKLPYLFNPDLAVMDDSATSIAAFPNDGFPDVYVLDIASGTVKQLPVSNPGLNSVSQMYFSQDGQLVVHSTEGEIQKLNVQTGKFMTAPAIEDNAELHGRAFNNQIYAWRTGLYRINADFKTVLPSEVFSYGIYRMKPSGSWIQVADGDSAVWMDATGVPQQYLNKYTFLSYLTGWGVRVMDFTPDRKKVILTDAGYGQTWIQDLTNGQTADLPFGFLYSQSMHPTKNIFVQAVQPLGDTENISLTVRDLDSGINIINLNQPLLNNGTWVAWSKSGQYLAYYSTMGEPGIQIYDLTQKTNVARIPLKPANDLQLLWAGDTQLYFNNTPNKAGLFDLTSKTTRSVAVVSDLTFVEPSGEYGINGLLRRVSLVTGQEVQPVLNKTCRETSKLVWSVPATLQVSCDNAYVQLQVK